MPRDLFVAVENGMDPGGRPKSFKDSTADTEVSPLDPRAMAKARTMSQRQFQRTASPKPSRTGGGPGLEMEPLVQQLASDDVDVAREAAANIRHGLKASPAENKARLLAAGGIDVLVRALSSTDPETAEHAVAAILNMSLQEGVEPLITRNGGLEAVVEVMHSGTPAARETAAAAIFTLSVSAENKERVRQAGAVPSLVQILQTGSLRGKKDASLALFNLALDERAAREIVTEGALDALFGLLSGEADPGLEDKVVAVVANLAKHQEGREAIFQIEGAIGTLVDIVDGGSSRSKEDAVVSLFLLATFLPSCTQKIMDEGAMPALGKLALSGTPRAKAKAKSLIEHVRSNRVRAAGSAPSSYKLSSSPSPPVSSGGLSSKSQV